MEDLLSYLFQSFCNAFWNALALPNTLQIQLHIFELLPN